MIIRIFRIDLFVSLLISTRQIKERVTSALVINYSRRKSQGRMKGGIGYLACIVIRLLTLLLNQNDVRYHLFLQAKFALERVVEKFLWYFWYHALHQIEGRENFIVEWKKNLIYLYISIRFLWNVYILLFLLCFIYFYETPSIWRVNLLTKMK